MAFVEGFAAAIAKLKGSNFKKGRLQSHDPFELITELLGDRSAGSFQPHFELSEMDAKSDTPVENLHVILPGFIKYFWRDAVFRMTNNQKAILKTRLSGLIVGDLQVSHIRGHALVQYAGSLVGRGFCVVIEVAPAVLYDVVPTEVYEARLASSRVSTLAFKPKIENIESHLAMLSNAVDNFLLASALWLTRWFNKPEFHIILHI
ncbi:hypothetical protein EIP91_005641 [Steccherinum ochraceum]|uniref:Uncharacterized protein n=1 Tax=Steccherinum ochraceum TaxID=92696 RepID=A0A4R0R9R9_9APHY|nr:hypothetical protein EIP91_005641 [Steccherinum ochraceum]